MCTAILNCALKIRKFIHILCKIFISIDCTLLPCYNTIKDENNVKTRRNYTLFDVKEYKKIETAAATIEVQINSSQQT